MTAVRAMTAEERRRGRRAALKLAADELEKLVAEIEPAPPGSRPDGEGFDAWSRRWSEWRGHYERVAALLREAHGARIAERPADGARMTLCGVTCSCTGGLPGLFPAWIQKARAEVERLT